MVHTSKVPRTASRLVGPLHRSLHHTLHVQAITLSLKRSVKEKKDKPSARGAPAPVKEEPKKKGPGGLVGLATAAAAAAFILNGAEEQDVQTQPVETKDGGADMSAKKQANKPVSSCTCK